MATFLPVFYRFSKMDFLKVLVEKTKAERQWTGHESGACVVMC